MSSDAQRQHRRSIRLSGFDYAQPGAYFITLVTKNRTCVFGDIAAGEMKGSAMGQIADEHWRAIPHHFPTVEIGAYVIMPNHIHGVIIINNAGTSPSVGASQWDAPTTRANGPKRGTIGAIIGAYKMSATRRTQNEWNLPSIWQRNYYEHVIRDNEEHRRIQLYIETNPENWFLDENYLGNNI